MGIESNEVHNIEETDSDKAENETEARTQKEKDGLSKLWYFCMTLWPRFSTTPKQFTNIINKLVQRLSDF